MSAAVNNKDEGNRPSVGLPVHLIQATGEAGMERTVPTGLPRDVRAVRHQEHEQKRLQMRSSYFGIQGGLNSSQDIEGKDSG